MPLEPDELPINGNDLTAAAGFYAVIFPPLDAPHVISTQSETGMAKALQDFYGTDTIVFVFHGVRWAISKGPTQRYLLGPHNKQIPIFKPECSTDIDPEGSLQTRVPG
jgi:hypothetical protein